MENMNTQQRSVLRKLRYVGETARAEAERLRSMGLVDDEAVWVLVLGGTVRAMQDLRKHQFAD